ncbi:hypothetical protein V495_05054 [Pseudogymnoascus sp. VKM F-4514 (FW-929)]|nr:hypothetical protein V495_05054 [Pseudogymnoascus sp. VKM F-4514 (FW-929)]KFY53876.1 hypothetical protein V497_08200 [Pseudogymnoascus sp. VKM F-4516 (FW-969)]
MSTIWTDTTSSEESETVSQLLRLPPEIILLVADSLPTQSAACLALCCHRLSHILGPKSWKSLRQEPDPVRFRFLTTLARELPLHFPCRQCLRVHELREVKWPRKVSKDSIPCTTTSMTDTDRYRHLALSLYEINYPQIQLAMRQNRSGTDIGFPLEAFQHLEALHDETAPKIVLSSVNAQIISNEFLVRFQTWSLVPWNRSNAFIEELGTDGHVYNICIHDRIVGYPDEFEVKIRMMARVIELEAGKNCQTPTLPCRYCYMDYMVDAKDFGEKGFAIITTKWVNFGAGLESPDAKWITHTQLYIEERGVHETAGDLGGVRAAFENAAEMSLEDLTSDNERQLFSTRNRCLVTRVPDGSIWRWRLGKRWYLEQPTPTIWGYWLDSVECHLPI